jgi:hypothetical protein
MPATPSRKVPWRDTASNEDLGSLLRGAVRLVREDLGHEGDDDSIDVEITVRVRPRADPRT